MHSVLWGGLLRYSCCAQTLCSFPHRRIITYMNPMDDDDDLLPVFATTLAPTRSSPHSVVGTGPEGMGEIRSMADDDGEDESTDMAFVPKHKRPRAADVPQTVATTAAAVPAAAPRHSPAAVAAASQPTAGRSAPGGPHKHAEEDEAALFKAWQHRHVQRLRRFAAESQLQKVTSVH
jgi:hypothetical protein